MLVAEHRRQRGGGGDEGDTVLREVKSRAEVRINEAEAEELGTGLVELGGLGGGFGSRPPLRLGAVGGVGRAADGGAEAVGGGAATMAEGLRVDVGVEAVEEEGREGDEGGEEGGGGGDGGVNGGVLVGREHGGCGGDGFGERGWRGRE